MPAESLQHLAIVGTTPVENMVTEFAIDIARFLGTDPRNRLVFYLIECFDWFKQFSDNCVCERVRLSGDGFPDDHVKAADVRKILHVTLDGLHRAEGVARTVY